VDATRRYSVACRQGRKLDAAADKERVGGDEIWYVSYALGTCDIGRIDQHGNPNGFGHQLMQKPQSLGHNFTEEKIDPRQISARPGEASNKTNAHRIFGDAEDDWDCRSRSFGRERSEAPSRCRDNSHLAADEVGH